MSQQPKHPDLFDSENEDPAGDPPSGTYVAPDQPMGAQSYGTTAAEMRRGEPISEREKHVESEELIDLDAEHLGVVTQKGDNDVDDVDDDAGMFGQFAGDEGDLSAEEAAMHTTDRP